MLFLDVAREIMLADDWTHRAVTVVMESHTGPGRFSFYGANHPDAIEEVHAGRVDVSTLNPAVMLTMAHRGTGPFDEPKNVAVLAVLPHYDQLGFAVANRLGFAHLGDIAAKRYPLRVSVRDYHLSHAAAAGRALPIETFHAKLIVADDTLAYVGSANLLNSSEGLSLETGLLVEGAAAVQVARLVDAVLRIARPL